MAQETFSRSTTHTLPLHEHPILPSIDDQPAANIPWDVIDAADEDCESKRLIMAIDFGTTFSSVAYVSLEPGESGRSVVSNRIRSIENYLDNMRTNLQDAMCKEVPTEVSYPLNRNFRARSELATIDSSQHEGGPELGVGYGQHGASDGDPDPMVIDDEDEGYEDIMDDDQNSFQWGYSVHQRWRFHTAQTESQQKILSRFKLLLHTDEQTEEVRRSLAPTLDELASRRIIKKPVAVSLIADYLTCLLRHAKSELQAQGLYEGYKVELALCIPAIWSQQACRQMQIALSQALKQSRFDVVDVEQNSIQNLFIVSEPEAAAAYVLENYRKLSAGSSFVLIDAGGGTVDANSYKVTQRTPLRLEAEGAPPEGGLYGSSYLNEAFRDMIRQRIEGETYLGESGKTLDGIAETITVNEYEYRWKRSLDVYNKDIPWRSFACPGLRANRAKGFLEGDIRSDIECRSKLRAIYEEKCFEPIKRLMIRQIEAAAANGSSVDKVVLIGGFAGNTSLRTYLKKSLEEYANENRCKIDFLAPGQDETFPMASPTTAVASGAVLRALNKDKGPQRIARSSYGIIRAEPWGYRQHYDARARKTCDECDGQYYATNTIDWVLKLGQQIQPVWECPALFFTHKIPCWPRRPKLECEELLYVSDHSTESHYKRSHAKNKGCEEVGRIITDFTHLRDRGLLQPVEPKVDANGKKTGKKHYKIDYWVVIRVVDRDLKCWAVYDGNVVQKCRINISAAFAPGVK